MEPPFSLEGGKWGGLWSAKQDLVFSAIRDTNHDGEIAGGDRQTWCVLKQVTNPLTLPGPTKQEQELANAVQSALGALGLEDARFQLENHGTLLAVTSQKATDQAVDALLPSAKKLLETASKVDERVFSVLLRHEPQLTQALATRSESGKAIGYAGKYGALLPVEADFAFSYQAATQTATSRNGLTPSAGVCNFTARSLSDAPVEAQFRCRVLGPTIHHNGFVPGSLTNLDEAPTLSDKVTLTSANQKVSVRTPADRNRALDTFQPVTQGDHVAGMSDGFDTRLVSVAKHWVAMGQAMEKQGARFVDPDFKHARPFAHTRLLPRLEVDKSATDGQVKPLAKKLLKLLNSHYRNHLRRETSNFLLKRGDQYGSYDQNRDSLTWRTIE